MSIQIITEVRADARVLFEAVTTARGYQGWWAVVCNVNCSLNQLSSIRFVKKHITEEMVFKTIDVKANERLVWLCISNNVFESMVNNTLNFAIKKSEKGSVLTFTQSSSDLEWEQHPEHQQIIGGWEFFMDSLKRYCETGRGEPWG